MAKVKKTPKKGAGKGMLETLFCIIVKFTTILDKMMIRQIYELVISDKLKSETVEYRKLVTNAKFDEAKKIKMSLSAFTPSGICEGGRTAKHFVIYSCCVMLDFDNISAHLLIQAIKTANECEYTLFSFVSISGYGLKILVRVDSTMEHHEAAYKQVLAHYEKLLNIKGDSSTKDLSRLCFLSHDPKAFINENASIFKIELAEPAIENQNTNENLAEEEKLFDRLVKYTSNNVKPEPGQRNNFIHLLANNCNKHALSKEAVLRLIAVHLSETLGLSNTEVARTVTNVYARNAGEFGIWSNQKQKPTVPLQLTLDGLESVLRKVLSEFIHPLNRKNNG